MIPRSFVSTTVVILAVALSICALAGPQPFAPPRIQDGDLDLSTWAGVTTLYHRLQDAAMLSCDPSGQTQVLPHFNRPESGECYIDELYTLLMKYENSALLSIHDKIQLEPIIIE